jgi:hypothetical protein
MHCLRYKIIIAHKKWKKWTVLYLALKLTILYQKPNPSREKVLVSFSDLRENYQVRILANFASFRVLAEGIKAFLSAD